ncbi:Transferase [Candidatus Magnetomoraceae bacterium gMMP-15]
MQMEKLEKLVERIIQHVNINLKEFDFDAARYILQPGSLGRLTKFYAFYGITLHHPLNFSFNSSNLAGSYFLGKCSVDHSILYKSDIRGDELKRKGEIFNCDGFALPIHDDEKIKIKNSVFIKTLVHNFSHDPESLEDFSIKNCISTHYANIHGSPASGCFFAPFSTVDLTKIKNCTIGTYSYVQTGELSHFSVEPGTIWVKNGEEFNFYYSYPEEVLNKYISYKPCEKPLGIFMDFIEDREEDFENIYKVIHRESPIPVPEDTALDRYAVVKGQTRLNKNVLVSQRAYLEDSSLGKGANAQENCYIINSHLEGNNVTAHGGKIINSRMGKNVFVGFNSFLRGKLDSPLIIGDDNIIMPHTIIDLEEPITIPSAHLVWGYIRNQEDLKTHSVSLEFFSEITEGFILGSMIFKGSGASFVEAFKKRIKHILEANGAYFDGKNNRGHAQKNQEISFNTIQPYPEGPLKGLYPAINIQS